MANKLEHENMLHVEKESGLPDHALPLSAVTLSSQERFTPPPQECLVIEADQLDQISGRRTDKIEGGQRDESLVAEVSTGKWIPEEHNRLLEALKVYGNQWEKVRKYVKTRSASQIRSHAQKYFRKLRMHEVKRIKRDHSRSKQIFAITREYLNRNPAPGELLEVPETAGKKLCIRVEPKSVDPPSVTQVGVYNLQSAQEFFVTPQPLYPPLMFRCPYTFTYLLPQLGKDPVVAFFNTALSTDAKDGCIRLV